MWIIGGGLNAQPTLLISATVQAFSAQHGTTLHYHPTCFELQYSGIMVATKFTIKVKIHVVVLEAAVGQLGVSPLDDEVRKQGKNSAMKQRKG
jgi:hypothetical protein